jgi:hypothetical protein
MYILDVKKPLGKNDIQRFSTPYTNQLDNEIKSPRRHVAMNR